MQTEQNYKLMILMSQHIPSDKRAEICLQYLRQIAVNNNREWFHEHRDLYDEARAAFESMVHDLIVRIAAFDPSVQYLTVADCTYGSTATPAFLPTSLPTNAISEPTSMPGAKSPTMADTTCTWNRKAVW